MVEWRSAGLPGVWQRSMIAQADERGSFAELWRESWTAPFERAMRQANVSHSGARVLRGLHLHRRQADLWVVLEGRPFIALVDVRPVLGGTGAAVLRTLDAIPGEMIYLPEGVAHGFYATDATTLVYFVTNEYDASDELTFAWDDPDVGVPWPDREPILSARDASAQPLRGLLARLRAERAG